MDKRLEELEAKRKQIEKEIEDEKIASSIKFTKAEIKKIENLQQAHIDSMFINVRCDVEIMINEDGNIEDVVEDRTVYVLPDDCVKPFHIKRIKNSKRILDNEVKKLAKKYNTTVDIVEGILL